MTKLNNQNTKEAIYTESKTLRNEAVASTNADFLDKIKAVQYLTDDMIMSIEQIANYYEVSKNSIKTIIQRNRDEFEEDGIKVLVGEELRQFKELINAVSNESSSIGDRVNSFTILTKRSMLRVGLIMTNCAVATKIRNYLLNLEEVSTQEQRAWATQREVGKIDRNRMTSAIGRYMTETTKSDFLYPKYTNMVYDILFGMTAKEIREVRNITKASEKTRDYLTDEELKLIDEAETIVTALVTLGFKMDYIKHQLKNKYQEVKLLN